MPTSLKIESMIYGGAGLARSGNETLLIPGTLPDEIVEAEQHGKTASLLRVLTPSVDRVEPKCIHFGLCGGCSYQHAHYEAQLAIKKDILTTTLNRAGVNSLPEIQTLSTEPWHYRNRVQFRIERDQNQTRIGYSQRASHAFLPITMCPITSDTLLQTAQRIETAINASPLASQPLRELELFTNDSETEIQASLYLNVEMSKMDRAAAEAFRKLCAAMPQLTGAGLFVYAAAPKPRESHRATIEVVRHGSPALTYTVNADRHAVTRGAFFQVNRFLVPKLVDLVLANRTGTTAWDLYAGAGLFSMPLTRRFSNVTAVESSERSYESLSAILRKPHRALRADTLSFLQRERNTPDLVVVDPPRAGLGLPVCDALASVAASTLIYVSCDPTTLARDLKRLLDSGYCLAELHLADLFPQTFHMESVAVLTR